MDTEYTLQQARFLERQSNELSNYAETLQRISNKLSSSWINGSRSSSYQTDFNNLINQFETRAQELQVLSNRVRLEVDEWLTMDSQGQTKTRQIRDGGGWGIIVAPLMPIINLVKGNLDPNTLTETRDYLLNTPDGIELERLAIEKGIKFVFEDGSFIGDPNGKEILIHFGKTGDYDGYYDINNKSEIVISDDLSWTGKGVDAMAGIMGHEMQHAIDDAEGKYFIPNLANITDKSQIEVLTGQQWDSYIDSEVRAYAREASITNGTPYIDDGVTSPAERIAFFRDYPSYEHTYEAAINAKYPDYSADVRLNSAGEVEVVLTPLSGAAPYVLA
jgi:hypothetical protein